MKNSESKNLLIVTNNFPHKNCPTAGTFTKVQVEAIAKYFNKVFVICPTPYMPAFISRFQFIPIAFRKAVNPIEYSYGNIYVYFPKFFMLPVNFSRKKAGERAYKSAIRVILNENINFDIIHAHFTYYAGYIGAKLKEKYKKPFVLTVHEDRDWFFKEISSKDKKLFYSWESADMIIRVNNLDLKEFERIGIEKERLICIPNAVADFFRPMEWVDTRKNLGLPINKKIVLSVSALEVHKGHEYLIKAVKKVTEKRDDILCIIIGLGPLMGKLKDLIKNLNLSNYIKLIGVKPHDELPLWMNCCDIFIVPSLSESFGVTQIEAMACGKPIVATINGGSEDIIVNENLGYLVETKNPEQLAEKILLVLNKEWDKEYILNYVKKFSSDEIAKEIIKIYERVMNK